MSDNEEILSSGKTKLEMELEHSELGGGRRGAAFPTGGAALALALLVAALFMLLVYEHMRVSALEKTVMELSSAVETLQGAGAAGKDEPKSHAAPAKTPDENKPSKKGKTHSKTGEKK